MQSPGNIEELLSKLFLNLEISELDLKKCSQFLKLSGWQTLESLSTDEEIRTQLSISRGPALKLSAAVALSKLDTANNHKRTWTLEEICEDMKNLSHEELRGIYWDDHGKIVHAQTLAVGTVDMVELTPYSALRPAFIVGSRRITLAHNHPSRDHELSIADIAVLNRLSNIATTIGIQIDPLLIVF
jgi:DNA repair protein RadC